MFMKNNIINRFHNVKLKQGMCYRSSLKKIFTAAEYEENLSGIFSCGNLQDVNQLLPDI